MTQKDLGKALLRLGVTELSGLPDVREQTWSILERDRRRVRRLTVMTVAAWLLSTVLILTVLVAFGLLFPSVAKLLPVKDVFHPAKSRPNAWEKE